MNDNYEEWLTKRIRELEEIIILQYRNIGNVNYKDIQQVANEKWLFEICLCKYLEYKEEKGE